MSAERYARPLAAAAVLAGVAALSMLAATGPGTRLGWWDYRTGLGLLRWAALLGIAAVVLAAFAFVWRRSRPAAATAAVLGLVALAIPWGFQQRARAVPPIHDITTDTRDPPPFVEVVPLRRDATNPPEHPGQDVAAQQRQAYPDLATLRLPIPADQAFARAVHAARELGWDVVSTSRGDWRLEATDTSAWFGFKDDVVVRIRPDDSGSKVDVRSKSRVGRSDVGANARRIRRFLEKMRRAGPSPSS